MDLENWDNLDSDLFGEDEGGFDIETRIIKPKKVASNKRFNVIYENAEELANKVNMNDPDRRYFCMVNGRFIFGDFIEALILRYRWHVKKLTISTLSVNQNNIDSLANLVKKDWIDEINLIVSATYYSNNRHGMIRYLYEELDFMDKFQFAVARSHCKIVLIETHCGKKIVIHGSANLPSCDCLEQFVIEQDDELYDFSMDIQSKILSLFYTINKDIKNYKQKHTCLGGADIWQKLGLKTTRKEKRYKAITP